MSSSEYFFFLQIYSDYANIRLILIIKKAHSKIFHPETIDLNDSILDLAGLLLMPRSKLCPTYNLVLNPRWPQLLKIEISLIDHYCYTLCQNEIMFNLQQIVSFSIALHPGWPQLLKIASNWKMRRGLSRSLGLWKTTIMKKNWTIPPISTKRTTTFYLKSVNTKKSNSNIWHWKSKSWFWDRHKNVIPTFPLLIIGYPMAIQI